MREVMSETLEDTIRSGSRMYVFKQHPSIEFPGKRMILISTKVQDGPQDDLINVIGRNEAKRNKCGDFFIEREKSWEELSSNEKEEFDCIHVFAVCRMVLTMYQRAFYRLGSKMIAKEDLNVNGEFDFKGKWGKKLDVCLDTINNELAARYTSGHMVTIDLGRRNDIYTCRSYDIVAHEVGHAVLDAMWKNKQSVRGSKERNALVESFGDLTALFTVLSQLDLCDAAISLSKLDVRACAFISEFAESFGVEVDNRIALRVMFNDYKLSKFRDSDAHKKSQIFSGIVFEFLVKVFEDHLKLHKYDPAETLFRVARFVSAITLGAFYKSASVPYLNFEKMGNQMVELLREMENDDMIGSRVERDKWAELLKNILHDRIGEDNQTDQKFEVKLDFPKERWKVVVD